jgi:hypothetical protein
MRTPLRRLLLKAIASKVLSEGSMNRLLIAVLSAVQRQAASTALSSASAEPLTSKADPEQRQAAMFLSGLSIYAPSV